MATLLLVFAVAKAWTLLTISSPTAHQNDPIVPFLTFREARWASVAIELFLAWNLLMVRSKSCGLVLVCGVSVMLAYKIGWITSEQSLPCGCLGVFESWLKLSTKASNSITLVILLGMLATSAAIMISNVKSLNTKR